jgi:hypothetical protein
MFSRSKGALRKFRNSPGLDIGQRGALSRAMNAGAPMRGRPMVTDAMMVQEAPAGAMMAKGGKAKAKPVKKMAKGGSASKRADGCATKGKTKGRFV